MHRVLTLLLVCAIFTLLFSFAISAQEDAKCFECHKKPEFAQKMSSHGKSLQVDEKGFSASSHADNGCISCHSDINKLPHAAKLKPVDCAECHEDQQKVYANSIHGKKRATGDKDAASCADCHTAHTIKPVKDPTSSIYPLNLPRTCGRCHANTEMAARHDIPVPDAFQEYAKSVHGKELLEGGLLISASCDDCHADSKLKMTRNGEEISLFVDQSRFNESVHSRSGCITCHTGIYEFPHKKRPEPIACGTCHNKADLEYKASIHAKSRSQGGTGAAFT